MVDPAPLQTSVPVNPSTLENDKNLVHLRFLYYKAVALLVYLASLFTLEKNPFKKTIDDFISNVLKQLNHLKDSFTIEFYKLLVFVDKKVTAVVKFITNLWKWLNLVLMYPVTAQFILLWVAFYLARRYNYAILHLRENYDFAKHIPLIPIQRISNDILEDPIKWILNILDVRAKNLKTECKAYEKKKKEWEKVIATKHGKEVKSDPQASSPPI